MNSFVCIHIILHSYHWNALPMRPSCAVYFCASREVIPLLLDIGRGYLALSCTDLTWRFHGPHLKADSARSQEDTTFSGHLHLERTHLFHFNELAKTLRWGLKLRVFTPAKWFPFGSLRLAWESSAKNRFFLVRLSTQPNRGFRATPKHLSQGGEWTGTEHGRWRAALCWR